MKKILLGTLAILLILLYTSPVQAFVQKYQYSEFNKPGFFSGIWHGLLGPYSLIARWVIHDVVMYAIPNSGWFYDFGFVIGMVVSTPIGWIAAILSTIGHIIS